MEVVETISEPVLALATKWPVGFTLLVLAGVPLLWAIVHFAIARPLVRSLERAFGGRLVVRHRKGFVTTWVSEWFVQTTGARPELHRGFRLWLAQRMYQLIVLLIVVASLLGLWVMWRAPAPFLAAARDRVVALAIEHGRGWILGGGVVILALIVAALDPVNRVLQRSDGDAARGFRAERSSRPGELVTLTRAGQHVSWEPVLHVAGIVALWSYAVWVSFVIATLVAASSRI